MRQKKYTKSSTARIHPICPDCGKIKNSSIEISHIFTYHSIGCMCKDNISYPEKLFINVLDQLKIKYYYQVANNILGWCENKRYDFYIPDYNILCEINGSQHYLKKFNMGDRTLQEEQANDKYKERLARDNGIGDYITIDCRYANIEWIKQSIISSKLNEIFDLSTINWDECEKYALKNIVKEVCEYWNNTDESTLKIGKYFNLSKATIISYLKKGAKLNWCDYDPKEEMRKSGVTIGGNSGYDTICLETGDIFSSANKFGKASFDVLGVKINSRNIIAVCNNKRKQTGGYHFKYVKDLSEEEKIKYGIIEESA